MGTFTTKLKLGDTAFAVRGADLDPYVERLTVGQLRVVETLPNQRSYQTDPCYVEEYMCIETGVGSGSVFVYGKNIFATTEEAERSMVKHHQPAYKQRAARNAALAEQAARRKAEELATLQRLKEKYEVKGEEK